MSEINKKLFTHSLMYGLVLAAVQILIQLIIYLTDVSIFNLLFGLINWLISMVVITFFMAYASVKFRDKYLERNISFLRCWIIGLIVGFTAVIIGTAYSLVFHSLLAPDYIPEQLDRFAEMMTQWNLPEDQMEEIFQDTKEKFTTGNMLVQSVLMYGGMALMISLLATLFVRKKERIRENIY